MVFIELSSYRKFPELFPTFYFSGKATTLATDMLYIVQHDQRTPPTEELTAILQQICHIAMTEPNISTCQDVGMWQM